jgi:hypothetical protein
MKRVLLLVSSLLMLAAEGGPSQARPQATPEPAPPSPAPSVPAAPSRDPLEEFVPHERLEADSVVALPVDI